MGLGKTLQAIAVAAYYKAVWPLLIIVPSSLRYVWIEELEKWLPDVLPNEINLIQTGFDTAGIESARVTLVTYGLLSCKSSATVKEALLAQNFNFVICDESHYFKNSRTECCKAVSPLLTAARHCLLLSGTPALAKPSELFTQLDALQPSKFGSWWSFTRRYCDARWEYFGRKRQWRVDGASNLEELQHRLQSLMIRREKDSVLTQLPPKQRQKILFQLKDSQTKKEILTQFAELKPMLKKSNTSLATALMGRENKTGSGNNAASSNSTGEQQEISILSRIQRLYKLAAEAKIGPAREYVQMLCENANLKFLVFAYHHCMMDGIQQTLWDKKVKFVRIDGSTKPSDRQLYVQQFQTDKDTRVAILSILAAGTGLTLTAAKLVVFAELYWTPGVMVQCEDRAHRIGQSSALPVHYLVARDTMDEWVWAAVCKKTLVTSAALSGKTRALQADAGSSYQVDLLSAADEYKPSDNSDIDISAFLQSQLPPDQKSILHFFSSQSEPSPSTQNGSTQSQDSSKSKKSTQNHGLRQPVTDIFSSCSSTPLSSNETPKKASTSSSACHKVAIVIESSEDDSLSEQPLPEVHKRTSVNTRPKKRRLTTDMPLGDDSESEFENSPHMGSLSVKRKRRMLQKTRSNEQTSERLMRADTTTPVTKRQKIVGSPHALSSSVCELGPTTSRNSEVQLQATQQADSDTGSHTVSSQEARPLKSMASTSKQTTSNKQHTVQASASGNGLTVDGGLTKWTCCLCTFSNHGLLPFCEMCETPRKENPKADRSDKRSQSPVLETVTDRESVSSVGDASGVYAGAVSTEHSTLTCSKASPSFQGHNRQQTCLQQNPSDSRISKKKTKRTLTFGAKTPCETDTSSQDAISPKENAYGSRISTQFFSVPFQTESEADATENLEVSSEPFGTPCDIPNQSTASSPSHCDGETDLEVTGSPQLFVSASEQDDSDGDTCNVSSFSSPESCPNTSSKMAVDSKDPQGSYTSHRSSQRSTRSEADSLCGEFDLESDSELIRACNAADEETEEENNSRLPPLRPPKRRRLTCDALESGALRSPQDGTVGVVESHGHRKQNDNSKDVCGGSSVGEETVHAVQEARKTSETECDALSSAGEASAGDGSTGEGGTEEKQTSAAAERTWSGKVHNFFLFCCSTYTGRVYIFNEHGESLSANFQPLDVELENIDNLPQLLHHPHHLRTVQTFVRQWNSLTDTKRRLISKRGLMFRSPLAAYDSVRTDMTNSKQRYVTKEDQAKSALKKASEVNGHVRVISKHHGATKLAAKKSNINGKAVPSSTTETDSTTSSDQHKGFVQVISEDGTPLCLQCQLPCSSLLSRETVTHSDNAWQTRFCSRTCADTHWIKSNTAYLRSSVYDVQHGVCQLCHFDAHSFFCQVRDTPDLKQRAKIIGSGKYSSLGTSVKKQMISKPYEGLFWHVDHIRPVWDGGGQCDIDNLRTLCTPCHSSVTSRQATKRAQARRLSKAAFAGDITAFFQKS
ncbi:hypothetical protein BaRGS_00003310 [Batillaria attramentaria]|uniref:DNA annealing helicase and endonuclease ZRANB3 n=1 Tax=Batillaria attramentaria TaxID=370345 RepID=A0ABD0M0X1_9CAEN